VSGAVIIRLCRFAYAQGIGAREKPFTPNGRLYEIAVIFWGEPFNAKGELRDAA
jgi:hypothetical protein